MTKTKIEFDSRDKDELKKYKQEILDKVAEVIENGGPFLILGSAKHEQVVTFGGGEDLVHMIASAMGKVKELRSVLEVSTEVYEYAVEQMTKKISDNPLSDIAKQLGCATCPGKDDCDVFKSELIQGAEPTMENAMSLLNELQKRHPEIVHLMGKSKGDC